jgi:hypothetical protein
MAIEVSATDAAITGIEVDHIRWQTAERTSDWERGKCVYYRPKR